MPKKPDYGRESAALLATSLVFLLGFVGILFIIAVGVDDPLWPALGAGAFFVTIFVLFVVGLRARNDQRTGMLGIWFRAKTPQRPVDYSPRRVRTSTSDSTSNLPLSADDLKDLQKTRETSPNTWVPSSVPKQNKTP